MYLAGLVCASCISYACIVHVQMYHVLIIYIIRAGSVTNGNGRAVSLMTIMRYRASPSPIAAGATFAGVLAVF